MLPTDGSDSSRRAIPLALAVAQPAKAVVHLVGVVEATFAAPLSGVPLAGVGMAGTVPADPQLLEEVQTNQRDARVAGLKTLAQQLSDVTGVRFEAWIEEGKVAAALARHAANHGVDLVVIATHGRGGTGRAILGSVADELVRTSPGPILLVPPHDDFRDEVTAATVHHILVPLDGTPAGDAIAGHAVSLAIALEARCTLLHVASSDRSGGSASIDTLADADIRHPADDAERARLERVADMFRERGVDTATALLHGTDPAYWIAEYASTHVVDLIAMSTHGRGGLERLVSGSISTEMVSRKQLPMLLVRSAA